MRFSQVYLESYAYAIPETVLTSLDIEDRLAQLYEKLNIPKGKLEEMTGIRERRVWPVGTLPSSIAAKAANLAIEKAKIAKKDIDLVIHTGVCRNALEPSTANVVHHELGLEPECMAFDVSNACVGFLNGLTVAASMIELGHIRSALVVTGENAGPIYQDTIDKLTKGLNYEDFRDSLASLTLGSAGVAFILTHKKYATTNHRLIGGIAQSDSASHDLCQGNGNVHHLTMKTNTAELMKKGLILAQVGWQLFTKELKWTDETPDWILTHQISKSHHEKFFQINHLSPNKGMLTISEHGNTGSAAAPMSLALASERGLLKDGDHIALLGIGSGLNILMLGIQW